MNKKFKFLTVLLALVMTIGVFAPFSARAEGEGEKEATTKTVTLHKILMDKSDLEAKRVKIGNDEFVVKKVIENDNVKYEAVGASKTYTKEELEKAYNDTASVDVFPGEIGVNNEKYTGNSLGNADAIKAYFGGRSEEIEGVYFAVKDSAGKYVTIKTDTKEDEKPTYGTVDSLDDKLPAGFELLAGKTGDNGIVFKTGGLKGEYTIEEVHKKSTYKGENGETLTDMKAVPVNITLPLVTENGIVRDVHVYPKNIEDKPQIDKNFKKDNDLTSIEEGETGSKVGAVYDNYQKNKATVTAEIGREIPYEVKTQLPKNAKYKTLRWSDRMTPGLTFKKDSLTITLKRGTTELKFDVNDYKVSSNDRGFDLEFTETGLEKLQKELETDSIEITLEYKATVNKDALIDVPEKNDIKLFYGNNKSFENEPTEVKPKDKKIEVKKSWDVTGDDTVTDADKTAVVTYILQKRDENTNDWTEVEKVTKKYDETNPQTSFNHTFENLDDKLTYRVIEEVEGYEPQYLITNEDGTVSIKNHKKTDNPKPLNPTEPKVITHGKKFVKMEKGTDKRLEGAKFVVKNSEGQYLQPSSADRSVFDKAQKAYSDAVAAYNNLPADKQNDDAKKIVQDAKDARDKAWKDYLSNMTQWGDKGTALELKSDEAGAFEIRGLKKGTYYLEEIKAPEGYALIKEPFEFEVGMGSYTTGEINYDPLETTKDAQRVDNTKYTIPQTGGIGTVIFTVVGVMLMVGAAFALKRRKEDELEGLA